MSEHATSAEVGTALTDSSVVRPDNATEGVPSTATAGASDSNGVSATGNGTEPAADAGKDDGESKASPTDEKPGETAAQDGTKGVTDTGADEGAATPSAKSKARRKSSGVPEHKGRKLNKKESKAKMSHLHVKPGEHYFIKFKGSPKWPGIIASEDMLPEAILKIRPVTAARPDGTYREDYADGGKNVLDRTFAAMFLGTNEFAWIPNTDIEPLDCNAIAGIAQGKLSKSLFAAYQLAAENHDLNHYKTILREFEEDRKQAREAKEASKAAKASAKKSKKSKDIVQDEDEDVEMAGVDEVEKEEKPKASKKRKAATDDDETSTPKRTDSVKKPKLKLINSAQKANGAETPKSAKEKKEKAKPKGKKANGTAAEPATPKEPELSPEEKRKSKEKEILFLRHKLQKGLLSRDQQPKEEEMKQMSEFITKLEGYSDLEVSIIRATKINKVLKAILKLDEIPMEAEFKLKDRSTELLAKWNKILESETPAPASAQANGTSKDNANGESAKADEETKTAEVDAKEDAAASESKSADKDVDMEDSNAQNINKDEPQGEEKLEVTAAEATPVETAA